MAVVVAEVEEEEEEEVVVEVVADSNNDCEYPLSLFCLCFLYLLFLNSLTA